MVRAQSQGRLGSRSTGVRASQCFTSSSTSLGTQVRKGCDFSIEISVCSCGMRDLHCPGHSLLHSFPLSLVHPEFTNAGATRGSSTSTLHHCRLPNADISPSVRSFRRSVGGSSLSQPAAVCVTPGLPRSCGLPCLLPLVLAAARLCLAAAQRGHRGSCRRVGALSRSVSFSRCAPLMVPPSSHLGLVKPRPASGSSPAPLVMPVPLVNSGGPRSESRSGRRRSPGVGALSTAARTDAVAASLASFPTVLLQPSPFLAVTSLDTYSTLQPAVCHSLTIANPRLFVFILILP
ncbi:uncharacterized protein [Vicugna pacos]|uniref:Uncharacterized protein n=1 Tax=Vicugna pacos TaxID=30538 RepID=A0ABM5E132_VICPA